MVECYFDHCENKGEYKFNEGVSAMCYECMEKCITFGYARYKFSGRTIGEYLVEKRKRNSHFL